VETFANIPAIIRNGGDWLAGMGTEQSRGTKVFALAGLVVNVGLVEVPLGITLHEIVYGIVGGRPLKAARDSPRHPRQRSGDAVPRSDPGAAAIRQLPLHLHLPVQRHSC
jgi:hypothetical protein